VREDSKQNQSNYELDSIIDSKNKQFELQWMNDSDLSNMDLEGVKIDFNNKMIEKEFQVTSNA
jgi:hypothetical protein